MDRDAVRRAWVRCVGAGEERNAGSVELREPPRSRARGEPVAGPLRESRSRAPRVRSASANGASEGCLPDAGRPPAAPPTLSITLSVGITNAPALRRAGAKPVRRRRVGEDVHEAAGAGRDRAIGFGVRSDVHDRQLAARLRGRDHRASASGARGAAVCMPVDSAVLVDDLDVVGSLGDARVDERLRLRGRAERRDGHAELRPVTLRRRHQRAGREDVGPARRAALPSVRRATAPPGGDR